MINSNTPKVGHSLFVGFVMSVLIVPAADAHGNNNMAPWDACKSQERGVACRYTDGHGDVYKGSCQLFSGALMCVRNQPIIRQQHDASDHSHTLSTKKGE